MTEWVSFLSIHAAILGLGRADAAALQRLRDACAGAGLDEPAFAEVLAAYHGVDRDRLREAFRRVSTSSLRFAVLADACQMARSVGIERIDREPALLTLSRLLAITPEQHAAVCDFIAASAHPKDPGWGGWRLQMDELRIALRRAEAVGVATDAVAGTSSDPARALPSFGGGSFLGVIRLMHELTLF